MSHQTSLEKFDLMVDTSFPSIKKYITSKNKHHIFLEEHLNGKAFGDNKDLKILFSPFCPLPIKKYSIKYKEKDECVEIHLHLL